MFFKSISRIIVVAALFYLQSNITKASESPYEYTSRIADGIFKIVSNKKISLEQQKQMLVEKFIGEIDFTWNARAVSGRFWKEMSDSQKSAFVENYKQFLINTWMPKFKGYKDEKYTVLKKYDTMESGDFIVSILIHTTDNKDINLALRLRQIEGSYKILNVIAEGIDMAKTYNLQFGEYAEKNGIDALIKYLKNPQPAKAKN